MYKGQWQNIHKRKFIMTKMYFKISKKRGDKNEMC